MSPIIVLDNVLKIWIELISLPNDNATAKFYRVRVVPKSYKYGRQIHNFEKFKNGSSVGGGALALRVIRAGTWLMVHRALPSKP